MATRIGSTSIESNASIKEEFCVQQEVCDWNTILNKVDIGSVKQPDIPIKSSTEILSELFGAFNAEPPTILEGAEQIGKSGEGVAEEEAPRKKKNKRSKGKYKHKDRKHKKKTKSSKKEGNIEESNDANGSGKKPKHPSERKKKKKKDSGMSESKHMPRVNTVSIKAASVESNNVTRTMECSCAEPDSVTAPCPAKDCSVPVTSEKPNAACLKQTASSQVAETEAKGGMLLAVAHPKQLTSDTKPRPGTAKIVIKNLKFSSVYEETVRQVEQQARQKAEQYEEGELSEETVPTEDDTPVRSAEHSPSQDKNEHSNSRKHTTTDDRRHHRHHHRHHHHHHRSRSRTRSRSHDRYKRSHSNNRNDRHHSRYSRKRSHSRDSRKRSHSRDSRKRSHSRDSTSTNHEHHRKRSVSRSRKRARCSRSRSRNRSHSVSVGHIDKQKLLEIARKNAMNLLKQGVLPSTVVTQDKMVAITAGGKSVAELTDFCKQLSKKEALGEESSESEREDCHSSGSDAERPFHHPFQIKERPSSIVMNIRNSVQLPLKTLQEKTAEQSKQLRIQFPVSSGQQHRKSENEWVPVSPKKDESAAAAGTVKVTETRLEVEMVNQVFPNVMLTEGLDIGSIVSQRLTAMRKLQENPNDVQALSEMYRAQKDMQMWAESKQQPGQFTGSTGVRVLSPAELASGYQAWAKKDLLTTASPVSGGMGMALLQKMGWRPGEGLGKNKEGTLEPLQLEIKMDKKGLVSQEEMGRRLAIQAPPNPTKTLVGKHPVSLLVEFCSKRRWCAPQFELCFECGPDHMKNFLFKVRVNGNEYKPSVASPNKKQAKAEAATICLQALGVLPS